MLVDSCFRITSFESGDKVVESRMKARNVELNLLEGQFVKISVGIAQHSTCSTLRFLHHTDKKFGSIFVKIREDWKNQFCAPRSK